MTELEPTDNLPPGHDKSQTGGGGGGGEQGMMYKKSDVGGGRGWLLTRLLMLREVSRRRIPMPDIN